MATGDLHHAREAFGRRDWIAARAAFKDADGLTADDVYAMATCAWWLGELDDALPLMQQAYALHVESGDAEAAAMVALDLGYTLTIRGDEALGSGWIRRAMNQVEHQPEGPVHGYLVYLDFEAALATSAFDDAMAAARRLRSMGGRFADPTLNALGALAEGRIRVKQGDVAAGMALLDEAMVAAVADDLDPGWAGNIYCHLMVACVEIADLRRAQEWTEATAAWCEGMPGAGPFLGICRLHRAQILSLSGAWRQAEREVARVCDELAHFDVAVVAAAHYERGEILRRRGDVEQAEQAYQQAHRMGHDPQPGRALLRVLAGHPAAGLASIRSALEMAGHDATARAALLPAAVEIALASGDAPRARSYADEMTAIAGRYRTGGFTAAAEHCRGQVQLHDGDAAGALTPLKVALAAWQEVDARYEAARVRLLLADAYHALGDQDSADLERRAAEDELTRLGAVVPPTVPAPRMRRFDGWSWSRRGRPTSRSPRRWC